MAVVYRAWDTVDAREVAVKRGTRQEPGDTSLAAAVLFEREFFTLSHLRHPRIVAVHDYGVDNVGPYYTMELLDGGDLAGQAPIEWRKACALLRDVCSALALLHSRRLVHRDLSPRNVRCTVDGLAKLIDFGAMSPMGPVKDLIGTWPCCAPETANLMPLDARTDLYSLGATLYYMLVGRHAYPARSLPQLIDMWRSGLRRPSAVVSGIPEALDGLVMDLMDQDPSARPASAAEVIDRLNVIANLATDEQLLVPQAYLSTPTLVGRTEEVATVRKRIGGAMRRRGASVLIRGVPGAGRSRLLDACVLEAKLAGALPLRADVADVSGADYGVVRALFSQLLRLLPDVAYEAARPHLGTLANVVPELLAHAKNVVPEAFVDAEASKRIQPALRQWLAAVSHHQPLVIAVDDVHRIDEGSSAFLSLLSNEISGLPVLLASTLDARAFVPAHRAPILSVLAEASAVLDLAPVSVEDTERLLGSIFGEQPNLAPLSHRLFGIAGGNPRDLIRLAQHLVDKGVARYQNGTWTLPEAVETVELPSSMHQALVLRVAALDAESRRLARILAIAPAEHFSYDECFLLAGHGERRRLDLSLDALTAREVFPAGRQDYRLGRQGWSTALREGMSDEETAQAHLALAQVFERREDGFRAARHLILGGTVERGIELFVAFVRRSEEMTNANPGLYTDLIRSLPQDWFASYEACFSLAVELGRSHADIYAMQSRLSGLAAAFGCAALPHIEALLALLHRECGLDIYESLEASPDPGERLKRALGAAAQRHAQTPEVERIVDPGRALRRLATVLIDSIGLLTITCDYATWKTLPSIKPFAALAPAFHIVDQLVLGAGARIAGRTEQCLAIYRALLERISQPDAGLTPTHYRVMKLRVMGAVCMLEAAMGVEPDPAFMAELEGDAYYESSAVLSSMQWHLWQGDTVAADLRRREVTLLQIRNVSRMMADGTHLQSELVACALMEDLTRVKRALDGVETLAREYVGWRPVLHYGRGEYHRICGDHANALLELDLALSLMDAGCHRAWAPTAGARVSVLMELGRLEDAKVAAEGYLEAAVERQIGYTRTYIELPLCLALARLGDPSAAVALWDGVMATYSALGISGLNLAIAHRTRARIALEVADYRAMESHASLARESVSDPGWLRRELQALRHVENDPGVQVDATTSVATVMSVFSRTVENFVTAHERAQYGLEALLRLGEATSGLLVGMTPSGPTCYARIGEANPALEKWASDYLLGQICGEFETGELSPQPGNTLGDSRIEHAAAAFLPVLLSHPVDGGLAITGVALLQSAALRHSASLARPAAELSRAFQQAGNFIATVV
jgi:hypothetical protein